MNTKTVIKIASIILSVISVVMIIISIKAKILPPALTGVGFLVIVWVMQSVK